MMEMTTSSPGPSPTTCGSVRATKLSDSLALRVNTICEAWGLPVPSTAPMNEAMRARAASMLSVASTERRYRPRSGLAFMVS